MIVKYSASNLNVGSILIVGWPFRSFHICCSHRSIEGTGRNFGMLTILSRYLVLFCDKHLVKQIWILGRHLELHRLAKIRWRFRGILVELFNQILKLRKNVIYMQRMFFIEPDGGVSKIIHRQKINADWLELALRVK